MANVLLLNRKNYNKIRTDIDKITLKRVKQCIEMTFVDTNHPNEINRVRTNICFRGTRKAYSWRGAYRNSETWCDLRPDIQTQLEKMFYARFQSLQPSEQAKLDFEWTNLPLEGRPLRRRDLKVHKGGANGHAKETVNIEDRHLNLSTDLASILKVTPENKLMDFIIGMQGGLKKLESDPEFRRAAATFVSTYITSLAKVAK